MPKHQLIEAAEKGDTATIEQLLNINPEFVNSIRDENSWAALHQAASANQPQAIKILLTHGAEIEIKNTGTHNTDWTPLHCASWNGSRAAITALLEAGANSNAQAGGVHNGKTPAEIAIAAKRSDIPAFIQCELDRIRKLKASEKQKVIDSDINRDLMLYYPLNGDASDASGNGNNGTIHNVKLVENRFGEFNSAYSFNGRDSWITIPTSPSLNPKDQLTISLWLKIDGYSNAWSPIIHKGGPVKPEHRNREYALWLNNQNKMYFASSGDNKGQAVCEINIPNDQKWFHYVSVVDRRAHEVNIYLNGKKIKTGKDSYSSFTCNNSAIMIGHTEEQNASYSPFKGVIDDVRIYNRALSPEEVEYLYRYMDQEAEAKRSRREAQNKAAVLNVVKQIHEDSMLTVDMLNILPLFPPSSQATRALSSDEMKQIFSMLVKNKSVQTLKLCQNLSGAEEALADLVIARPELTTTPQVQDIPNIHAIMQQKKKQRRLEQERILTYISHILNNFSINAPNFADINLSANVVVTELAKLLDNRPDFTAIDLTDTNLNFIGWQIVLSALRKNRVITQINFSRDKTPAEVKGQIYALLALNKGERDLELQRLCLESRTSFSYVLGLLADHAAVTLNLNSFALTAERAQILAEFITKNRRLATLSLHEVQCTGDAGYILMEAIKQNTPLNMDFTEARLDRNSAFILCDIVKDKPIVTINLTNCDIPVSERGNLQMSSQQNRTLPEVIGFSVAAAPVSSMPLGHRGIFTPPNQSALSHQSAGESKPTASALQQQSKMSQ
jgi:hypothetical protein